MSVDRDRIASDYWYLCRRAARRFVRPGLDRADLEQIAALGLVKAIDRYDRNQTTPFAAYAWLLIVGELMHHVRDAERVLRAPRRVRELERKWSEAERELWNLLGREPSERDVATLLDLSASELREIRAYRASKHVTSFELVGTFEGGIAGQGIDGVLERIDVERCLALLTPLERQIVESVHFQGASMMELSHRLGYSRRHIARLHNNALTRLRNSVARTSHC